MSITGFNYSAFYKYLDTESQANVLYVNKLYNKSFSLGLLSELGIKPIEGFSPYKQIMGIFRLHCDYFCRKLPEKMKDINCRTLIEAKKLVDSRLSGIEISLDSPAILASISQVFLKTVPESVSIKELAKVIEQDLCTLEVAERIDSSNQFSSKYRAAIVSEISKNIQFEFYKYIAAALIDKYSETLILELIHRNPRGFIPSLLDTALAKRYREPFILSLLHMMPYNAQPYHVQTAMQNKYSESLVLTLLEKCSGELYEYHIQTAMQSRYSESLILTLLEKYSGELYEYNIQTARQLRYSDKTISALRARVNL